MLSNCGEELDNGSECEADLTNEIRQMIAEAQSDSWFDEDDNALNIENLPPNQNVGTEKSHRKSTNPIISSPDYIAAMTEVQKRKAEMEMAKKSRRAVRLEKAREKLEKMQQNISKLQQQVSKDKN